MSLLLFCEGAHFVLVPNILKKLFGKYSIALYGFAFSYTSIGNLLIVVLQGALIDEDDPETYSVFFMVNGAMSAVALIILLIFFKEEKFIP